MSMEHSSGKWRQASVNVTSARTVVTTLQTTTKVSTGLQSVDVVRADKVLRKTDNRLLQGTLTVLVGRQTRDVTCQFNHLHILFQVTSETGIQDLTLTRFQTIDDRRDGPNVIRHTEKDQFLVDEVCVTDLRHRMVEIGSRSVLPQPFLSLIGLLLREGQLNELGLMVLHGMELFQMAIKVLEVNLRILGAASTQTLVVLVVPAALVSGLLLPRFVLRHGEERTLLDGVLRVTLPDLYDRGNEFNQEFRNLQQTGKLGLEEVDEQSLDVASVMVLIGHDHQVAVAETTGVGILLLVLQSQKVLDVLNFLVLRNLVE